MGLEVDKKYNTIAKNTLGKNIGCTATPYLPLEGCNILKGLRRIFNKRPSPFMINSGSNTYICNNIPSFTFLFKVKQTLDRYGTFTTFYNMLGVAVVRNVFSKDQIREIKSKLYIKSTLVIYLSVPDCILGQRKCI